MLFSRRLFLQGSMAAAALAAPGQSGTSMVIRLADRKLVHIENPDLAARALLPPASTMKPFALLALLEAGKLQAEDQFACSRHLDINGHSLNCIHPVTPVPMNVARAIAYSCNGAVAHFALRFAVDELPQAFTRYGFTSRTGLLNAPEATGTLQRNTVAASCQLQAMGEESILVTPLELLLAYARLCHRLSDSHFAPIREGMEGAVEFGTAQAAKLPGVQIAGKTGSIMLRSGASAAWFAGFAPSRAPQLAVVVLTPGRSGGTNAAPIAAGLLKRYLSIT